MFLISNKLLEQLEFKLEKIIGIEKHAGKVRKYITYYQPHSQFEKPSCAENLTFIIFHESAPFKLFENFYVHFTTAISQLEYLLTCTTLESTKYLNLRLSVQKAQLLTVIFNDSQFFSIYLSKITDV